MNNTNENKTNTDGWSTYEKLVLSELERHNEALEKLDSKFSQVQVQIVTMETQIKTKSVMLATLTSLIISPIVGALAVFIFNNLK